MNLGELQTLTLDYLGDPSGQKFAPGGDFSRVNRLINEAYDDIVLDMDDQPLAWDVMQDPLSVAIVEGTTEYQIDTALPIRKVQDVVRIVGTKRRSHDPIPWSERHNHTSGYYVRTLLNSLSGIGYPNDLEWHLGVIGEPPAHTAEVFFSPSPQRLTTGSNVPTSVPPQSHGLIAVKAAILGKQIENREIGQLAGIYSEKLGLLRRYLRTPTAPGKAKDW